MAVWSVYRRDERLSSNPLVDMVVAFCAAGSILDIYRRGRDNYGLCSVVRKGEYAKARRGLFGKERTDHHAAGGQSFNVVGVWGASGGNRANSL